MLSQSEKNELIRYASKDWSKCISILALLDINNQFLSEKIQPFVFYRDQIDRLEFYLYNKCKNTKTFERLSLKLQRTKIKFILRYKVTYLFNNQAPFEHKWIHKKYNSLISEKSIREIINSFGNLT